MWSGSYKIIVSPWGAEDKYLSHGAANKNTPAMEILAYNCKYQLSTVGTYYRHTVYFQYN